MPEIFCKNSLQLNLAIFEKSLIIDVCQDTKYASKAVEFK